MFKQRYKPLFLKCDGFKSFNAHQFQINVIYFKSINKHHYFYAVL